MPPSKRKSTRTKRPATKRPVTKPRRVTKRKSSKQRPASKQGPVTKRPVTKRPASKQRPASKRPVTKEHGFMLVRQKYYTGEALDFGIPTDDKKFGTLVINATMQHGRRQKIDEIMSELTKIIKETPPDDKTEKRRQRLIFLQHIKSTPILVHFYETIQYYLNGGPIEWDIVHPKFADGEPDVCVITSGGNIIMIIANFFRLIIQNKPQLATQYINLLGLIIDMESVANAVKSISTPQFIELVLKMSESLPSDLDYKICPTDVEPFAQPEEYQSYNPPQPLTEMHEKFDNQSNTNNALTHLSQAAAALEDTALLNHDVLEMKIHEIAEQLSIKIGERPTQKIYPGENTQHLYTQVVQEQHREKYTTQRDLEYINFLLNEKDIIRLNTQLNSLCMASAFTVNQTAPPLITFMFAIHLISLRANVRINSILWDNDITITRKSFQNLTALKNSNILVAMNRFVVEMHNFPIFHRFMERVDEIMESNAYVIDNAGSSWSSAELSEFIKHSELKEVYRDNLRTTMNIIRPKANLQTTKKGDQNLVELKDDGQNDESLKQQSISDLIKAAEMFESLRVPPSAGPPSAQPNAQPNAQPPSPTPSPDSMEGIQITS